MLYDYIYLIINFNNVVSVSQVVEVVIVHAKLVVKIVSGSIVVKVASISPIISVSLVVKGVKLDAKLKLIAKIDSLLRSRYNF